MNQNEQTVSVVWETLLYGNSCPMTEGECHADFEVNRLSLAEGDFIIITDLDRGNKSVTNDINYVIESLHHQADFSQPIDHYKILYRDSMKMYDGIQIKNGQFMSFYPLQEKELKEAIKKALMYSMEGVNRL